MNILIINHYAGSEGMGMEHRPYYLAKWWQSLGAKVVVATAGYSHLRHRNPHKGAKGFCTIDGTTYYIVPTPPYKGNSGGRAANVAAFLSGLYLNAEVIVKEFSPHVVIASSTYPLDIFVAEKFKRLCGAKIVFELHDLWPLSLMELYGYSKSNVIMQMLGAAERYSYEKSDLVVSILPNAKAHIIKNKFRVKDYIHIPNGVDTSLQHCTQSMHLDEINSFKAKMKFTIGYGGGFAKANCTKHIAALSKILGGKIGIVMIGGGDEYEEIKKQYKNTDNLLLLPSVPQKELIFLLSKLDCLYLPARDLKIYRYGVSMNKIFDYMLAGRPVIFGVNSKNSPIEKSGCGLIVKPQDINSVKYAIKKLIDIGEFNRFIIGRNGKVYVMEHHDYKRIAAFYLEQLRGRFNIER